jgi:hypothetical protein
VLRTVGLNDCSLGVKIDSYRVHAGGADARFIRLFPHQSMRLMPTAVDS